MIKAEKQVGERTLRSASPHRNAYKSDFHAIKCTFDGPKSESGAKSYTNGSSDTREDSRGRPFGTRVNKIKNIFLQMDGQQQECQEVKSPVKPDVPQVSPPKLNTQRVNFNTSTSPEIHNLDKTPKGEDVEIDKVALAEKFSVTRKLFERGIKDQPAAEKQSPNRVSNRLSFGSASDEGKNIRRVSGSSETAIKPEQTPTSAVKCRPDEKADGEKKHSSRTLLNAGPISKRLENYMAEADSEENNLPAAKGAVVSANKNCGAEQSPTSPTRETPHKKPMSPVKETTNSSPVTNTANKVTFQMASVVNKQSKSGLSSGAKSYKCGSPSADDTEKPVSTEQTEINHGYKCSSSSNDGFNRTSVGGDDGKPHSPPPRDVKQTLPSACGFQNTSRAKNSETISRSNDSESHNSTSERLHSQNPSLDSKGGGMVRAELVVVHNESSESEEHDDENAEDDVFKEEKLQKSPNFSQQVSMQGVSKKTYNSAETLGEGRVLEDGKQFDVKEDSIVICQDGDDNHEEDEEVAEEEIEMDGQVGQSILERASPVVYGIENAAFVDDRDVDQILREEDEEEEEEDEEDQDDADQRYMEYDDIYEAPALSDEEEPPPKRKIQFSTDPILVSVRSCLHLNLYCAPEPQKTSCTDLLLQTSLTDSETMV